MAATRLPPPFINTFVLVLSATVLVLEKPLMAEPTFDHERLDIYRLSIDYVAFSFPIARTLQGVNRQARDQWLRAAQSIPLNIAEGNGKQSLKDKNRFFEIACGSALECAAIQDVLVVSGGIDAATCGPPKAKLKRIVAMLTRLAMRSDRVDEFAAWYDPNIDYDYEHDYGKRRDKPAWS